MRRRSWLIACVITTAGILLTVWLSLAPKSPIPPAIKNQLTSTLLMPIDGGVRMVTDSAKYDASTKLLTYKMQYDGSELTVSEQPTPEQFVDIPDYYKKVVGEMNDYTSFDVNVGTVYLTKPKQFYGKEVAVLNAKGTLVFIRANNNLSTDQWRMFFNHFQVQD